MAQSDTWTSADWRLEVDPTDQIGELLERLEPEPEPRFRRHEVERIERWVTTERRLGLRTWTDRELVVVYRTVKP